MDSISDILILGTVVLGRFVIPLFIFRYPLPIIIAAMLLDAADEPIFSRFTNVSLDNYQSYDKALDVYYLALAYIATMRNWSNVFAFQVGQFLWYYRLAGVALFELTGARFVLFLFPNTFEYYFIFYEAMRTRLNPALFAGKVFVLAAAIIWVGIKIPQEFWIHVLKLDVTDFIKEHVLGGALDDSWLDLLAENLWVFPVLLVLAGVVTVALLRLRRHLPPAHWPFTLDANVRADKSLRAGAPPVSERHWREGLIEKFVLVSLMVIIFARMLPDVETTDFRIIAGVIVVIVSNAFISHWLAMRGTQWRSLATEFAALAAINLVVALAYILLLPHVDNSLSASALLFFILLLTLLIVVYDRYKPIADLRQQVARPQNRS